jgi:hypothetical protein
MAAKKNPVGPRIGTIAAVGIGGFLAYRYWQRSKLATMLEEDPILGVGFVAEGGSSEKAAELLPLFGFNSPEEAYEQVRAELPIMLPEFKAIGEQVQQFADQLPKVVRWGAQ